MRRRVLFDIMLTSLFTYNDFNLNTSFKINYYQSNLNVNIFFTVLKQFRKYNTVFLRLNDFIEGR